MSTEALSSERQVSFWEIKNQEGFKSPTLQAIALNSNLLDEEYQFLVCTMVQQYLRCLQHFFLSLLGKSKMQLFRLSFTLINMSNILYRLPK